MKSGKKRIDSRKGAVIALCVVLVLTILFGVLGFTGLKFPPRGLYKLLSWLPTSDSDNWPESLPLGLDLQGGMYVEYKGTVPEGTDASFDDLVDGTITIIRDRLSDKGITEANIQSITTSGLRGIRVEIPNVQDETVLELIGAAANMTFIDPDGNEFMTGNMVKTANYSYGDKGHQVEFELTSEGAELFARKTSENIGKNIKIMLDGETLVNATVQTTIADGRGVITGNYSQSEATTIAAKIRSGALPLQLERLQYDKVSATLGKDALSTSVTAAFIGILLIMALMIVRYRLNGVIASWALTVYIILLFFLIALFGIQLTLPGLAGIVLGIGMAVDANVIIFERFNEEARKGKSARLAVRAGFKNALSAILDANITTLIAAIVLMILGSGTVKGFGRTLMLSVIVSMISAVLVTRFLMNKFVAAGCTDMKLFAKVNADKEVAQ